MSDAKQQLRGQMRSLRGAIVDRDIRAQRMWAALIHSFGASGVGGRNVLAFVGVASEPDTGALIETLHQLGAIVYLPRVEGDHIVAVRHNAAVRMESGAYGIPAPAGPSVSPGVIDIVIVPGLAFTSDGRRLGQGGGYYDRYIPLLRTDCETVGVCFHEQLVQSVPGDLHDQRVSRVVTDGVRE